MLKSKLDSTWKKSTKKKSNQGNGKYSKHGNKGGGADGSGFSRLPALEGEGVIAATVSAASARIGDARSAWESGIISHANTLALAAGIALGDDLPTFADKAIAARRGG